MEKHLGRLYGRQAKFDIKGMTLFGSDAPSIRPNLESLLVVCFDDLMKLGARQAVSRLLETAQ